MTAPEKIAVSADQVSAGIGKRSILHGITLPLAAGRWTSIVGPNGAGKSTLLKVLAGLLPAQSGQVALFGRALHDWSARERARQMAWLGQNEAAADDLTVLDVALLGRLPHQGWLQPPSLADHAAAEAALRWQQPGQHLEQRGFARAVGADDAGPAARRQRQRDAMQYGAFSDASAYLASAKCYFFRSIHNNPPGEVRRCISHNK